MIRKRFKLAAILIILVMGLMFYFALRLTEKTNPIDFFSESEQRTEKQVAEVQRGQSKIKDDVTHDHFLDDDKTSEKEAVVQEQMLEELVKEAEVKVESKENIFVSDACADRTMFGKCSDNKPKFCKDGNLIDNCIVCGCYEGKYCRPSKRCARFAENVDCENKNYRMAFILLVENHDDATSARLNKLSDIKKGFAAYFSIATQGMAQMKTSSDITVITTKKEKLDSDSTNEIASIIREFYQTHDDIYDFISLYFSFRAYTLRQSHATVVSNIENIGMFKLYDDSLFYGSGGKLKGINFMDNIDMYEFYEDQNGAINALLHETGHQWCCYVGDDFAQGQNQPRLEIIQQGMHWYKGLHAPYRHGTALGAAYWEPNQDNTFNMVVEYGVTKYHPFTLYLMGLLSEREYSKKFPLYDAGLIGNWNFQNVVPYNEISVDDIIEAMGERKCVLE